MGYTVLVPNYESYCSLGEYVGTMQVRYRMYRLSLFSGRRDEKVGATIIS